MMTTTTSSASSPVASVLDRIRSKEARVGVIGLGYVGLPLAVEFSRAGFHVTGFDVDGGKTSQIVAGERHIPHGPHADLSAPAKSGQPTATTDMAQRAGIDAIDNC